MSAVRSVFLPLSSCGCVAGIFSFLNYVGYFF